VSLKKEDLDYFDRGRVENPKFWSRLGGEPSFSNLKVLDVGCGHGSQCVYVASRGAKKVTGIDIDETIIEFARKNVRENHKDVKDAIDFHCLDISELKESKFDIIYSKDSFEHIIDLERVFSDMKSKLKADGKIYIGFTPLYNSPYGDHKLTAAKLPWGHLLFSEERLIKKINRNRSEKITRIEDLGLNKKSLADFRSLFYNSGMEVQFFGVNISKNPVLKIFNLMKRIPALEEYFSYNLYCVLEK
jgi:SAM-dependent methyltransferase